MPVFLQLAGLGAGISWELRTLFQGKVLGDDTATLINITAEAYRLSASVLSLLNVQVNGSNVFEACLNRPSHGPFSLILNNIPNLGQSGNVRLVLADGRLLLDHSIGSDNDARTIYFHLPTLWDRRRQLSTQDTSQRSRRLVSVGSDDVLRLLQVPEQFVVGVNSLSVTILADGRADGCGMLVNARASRSMETLTSLRMPRGCSNPDCTQSIALDHLETGAVLFAQQSATNGAGLASSVSLDHLIMVRFELCDMNDPLPWFSPKPTALPAWSAAQCPLPLAGG